MLSYLEFLEEKLSNILYGKPQLIEFLIENGFCFDEKSDIKTKDFFNSFGDQFYIEKAIEKKVISKNFYDFYIYSSKQKNQDNLLNVDSITIIAGENKYHKKELFSEFTISKGEIISIVGKTGSGKSRLLADIEWMASKDTPTKREILINGINLPKQIRYSSDFKLVAQLSQNMNFVMDLTVYDFLRLHAESRGLNDIDKIVDKVIFEANKLSGESFSYDTAITSLSGGQSRALMISDVAILSKSPIVLIDEIENAGVDRKKSLNLLLREDKIVLIATHDPILALSSDKRIIIKDGGIDSIVTTSSKEKELLLELELLDEKVASYRNKLRDGKKLF